MIKNEGKIARRSRRLCIEPSFSKSKTSKKVGLVAVLIFDFVIWFDELEVA